MKTLKNVLLINGISSGATGLGLVLFATPIAELFGTSSHQAMWFVGGFLLSFATLVLVEGLKDVPNMKMVRLIIVLDISWVIASVLVVALQLFKLSSIGYLAIGAVAIWVAAMAYFQLQGVKENASAKV
jgi:hypothetical protein